MKVFLKLSKLLVKLSALSLSLSLVAATSHANPGKTYCVLGSDKTNMWISLKNDSGLDRPPTVLEVMRLMNRFPELHAALQQADTGMLNPADGSWVPYWFRTLPKEGKSDPACHDRAITGFECRDIQIKGPRFGVPSGMQTPFWIMAPIAKKAALENIMIAMHCPSDAVSIHAPPPPPPSQAGAVERTSNAQVESEAATAPRLTSATFRNTQPISVRPVPQSGSSSN